MNFPILVLVVSFLILLALNVPVAFCMGIASMLAIGSMGGLPAFTAVAHKLATGIDSFALLAIPFFVLSGLLMGHGGIARRLIDFANLIVGWWRGGLALVNVLTCMIFGAISGSATAAISSVGGFMIPLMNKKGYARSFNTSVTITAATTGLLIPPSNIMIVYSLATGGAVSIAALFMAGVIPGILVGLALMVVSGIISLKRNYGKGEAVVFDGHQFDFMRNSFFTQKLAGVITPVAERRPWLSLPFLLVIRFVIALPALLLIIIVIGGILKGIFTPTEASAVAVLYSFILAVFIYREVRFEDIPKILLQAGETTAVVFLLIGTSMAMSWVLAAEQVPQNVSSTLLGLTSNGIILMLLVNLILLSAGTFLDMTPAVLIFTPVFLPIAAKIGVTPLHLGIIMIMNLCIGLCTPPVGTCLFLGCAIGKTTVAKIIRQMLVFFAAMIAVLLLCTYVPSLSLWLPGKLGLYQP